MEHLRRYVIPLALSALCVAPASAQIGTPGTNAGGPLTCTAAAATPTLRAEGYTELIGDILITCTGGSLVPNGTAVGTANITVNMSVPGTSRILNSAGNYSEALLLIDDPGSSVNGTPGRVRRFRRLSARWRPAPVTLGPRVGSTRRPARRSRLCPAELRTTCFRARC